MRSANPRAATAAGSARWVGKCRRGAPWETPAARVIARSPSCAAPTSSSRSTPAAGGVWAIHPEGTRSPDGRIYRGRTGTLRVAMATGAPVVPVTLAGTDRVNPRGSRLPRFGKVRIEFGAPRRYPATEQRHLVRAATDQLMREMAARSGRHYVDRYAATFQTLASRR
ncbi:MULTISPECIES: lysophospholipid acyltransferase family protein [Nocardia]|uniref:lysophospholipid acyltransferase family protein n=2 Tax=Nocardia TaxID=1817 RepID=UPI002B4B188E|nr:lysophospholipid acyltransferase family protein [Nocardia abscessus]